MTARAATSPRGWCSTSATRNRYLFAGQPPRQPLPKRWFESGCMVRASSLAELATKMDVPAESLTATVEKFNGFARAGRDEDFHRARARTTTTTATRATSRIPVSPN